MKKIILLSVFLVPALSSNKAFSAPPLITVASSSNTAGGTVLTLSGTDFGTKPGGAKPLHVWMEGQTSRNPHADYSRDTTWNEVFNAISPISSGVAHGGITNMQLKLNFEGCNTGNNYNWYIESSLGAGATMFMMMDRYHNYDQQDPTNIKLIQGWPSGYGAPKFLQSFDEDNNYCYTEVEPVWVNGGQGVTPPKNIWLVELYEWRKGNDTSVGSGLGDGLWRNIRNNVLNQYGSNLPNGAGQQTLWWMNKEFAGSGNCPDDLVNEYDLWKNLYIDNSLSAVFISSAGTGGSCTFQSTRTFVRPAVPFAWSDTEISAYNNIFNVDTTNGLCVTVRDQYGQFSNTVLLNGVGSTPLTPVLSNVTSSAMDASWTDFGTNYTKVLDNNSDFSSPISSVTESGNTKGYSGLSASTQHFFQVKIATESDTAYSLNQANATTDAPPVGAVTPSNPKQIRGGVTFRGNVTFK